MDTIDAIAKAFHDAYEAQADAHGWKPQESTRVPYEELPKANRELMRAVVAEVFTWVGYWRSDVSDQCQHCEPDRLYQRYSQDEGHYYDAEDEADRPVFILGRP